MCSNAYSIAEQSTIFQLTEGRRGIFVGCGATARVGCIIGPDRMIEMMLTGQKYFADDALSLRLAHYSVADGDAMELAQTLAGKMSHNALLTFFLNSRPSCLSII